MNKIGIIGTGKLGTRLAEQLVLDGHFDEIRLWNRSPEKQRGTFKSLKIWASIIKAKTKIIEFDQNSLESLDIIIIAIKERYDPRIRLMEGLIPSWIPQQLRYAGLLIDLPQVKDVCGKLIDYQGIVAVITNPVDIITSFTSHYLPKAKVFGLGSSVDSARLSYTISEATNCMLEPQDILVGGEHGQNTVPLTSLWNLKKDILDTIEEKINRWTKLANELSIEIVTDLGYTLQDCAVMFSRDISWLSGKIPNQRYAVFSIPDEIASIGSPVTFENDSTIKVRFDSLSDSECKKIEDARSQIGSILNKLKEKDLF